MPQDNDHAAHGSWAGRVEDDALLRGRGRFGDDVRPERTAVAVFVRSPHAHAQIRAIDVAAAKELPGVLAVITGADLSAENFNSVSQPVPMPGRDGKMVVSVHRPALAGERVLHVGEPVALIVAETLPAAQDASTSITRRSMRSPTRLRQSRPARRSYGRRRPATWRSTGRRPPTRTAASRRRSTASSRRPRT